MAPESRVAASEMVVRFWVFLEVESTEFAVRLDLGYEKKEKSRMI